MLLTQPNKFTVSTRTIKNNHLFLVDTMYGAVPALNDSGLGLYNLDTRHLSCFEIKLNNTDPVCLLSSTEVGYLSTLVYTNGQIACEDLNGKAITVLEETIQLKRESVLDNALYEKFTLTSYNVEAVKVQVSIRFDADFRDIFEIRHLVPFKQRQLEPPVFVDDTLIFAYREGCKTPLETRIRFKDFTPRFVDPTTVVYETVIYPLERKEFNLEIITLSEPQQDTTLSSSGFGEALSSVRTFSEVWKEEATEFISDNEDCNEMFERSRKDIRMLLTQNKDGNYFVAAGIPWYVCLFGRDSIITARECMILNPALAKWTLHILAEYQGQAHNPWRDEAPGKILHELRTGELACLEEIPHTPYYGSVDATPLWLILLYDYYLWTRDFETVKTLWPHALAALGWIDAEMKKSALGYVTYRTTCPIGIVHQGWKDSNNSAMYENGLQAEPPIALAEVQGYVYLAKRRLAALAELMGDLDLRNRLKTESQALRNRFNTDFWMPEHHFCAMGLDSQGRQLRVVSSNPGHCLETGIFTPPHARRVASRLMMPDMFSGWGIRTLSASMLAYNPMSYHNGSIWPHDNAMIAQGFACLGRSDYTEKVFTGLFEAARLMFYKRLPELFCGFSRDVTKTDPPVRYPVACSPQAWSAGAVFWLIQSMLNLSPDVHSGTLRITQPKLPHWMNMLQIRNLRVGPAMVDLAFRRVGENVVVDVSNRRGKMDVIVKI